jgi:HPt (histidine-containing phosphotransfer) domain-containing protein
MAMIGDDELCLAADLDAPGSELEVATFTVDPEALEMLRSLPGDQGGDLLSELIVLFIPHGQKLLSAATAAIAQEDAHALAEAAHSLKGSGAQFGADRLVKLCGVLEAAGRNAQFAGTREAVAAAEREFHRVTAELQALPPPSSL